MSAFSWANLFRKKNLSTGEGCTRRSLGAPVFDDRGPSMLGQQHPQTPHTNQKAGLKATNARDKQKTPQHGPYSYINTIAVDSDSMKVSPRARQTERRSEALTGRRVYQNERSRPPKSRQGIMKERPSTVREGEPALSTRGEDSIRGTNSNLLRSRPKWITITYGAHQRGDRDQSGGRKSLWAPKTEK